MQPTAKRKPRAKNNKRRRLPNGFGQITEIKTNNLRKPFRAMVTVGKTAEGKPICRPLKPESYFLTYNDAYAALVEYNKNPYDLEPSIAVKELYVKWTEEYTLDKVYLRAANSETSLLRTLCRTAFAAFAARLKQPQGVRGRRTFPRHI